MRLKPPPTLCPNLETWPLGKVEIPSMAPDIHAGAIGGAYTGGVAAPATAFGAPASGTSPFGSGGDGAPAIAFDPWDYSRPAPDGYTLPWAGRGVKNRASPDVPPYSAAALGASSARISFTFPASCRA